MSFFPLVDTEVIDPDTVSRTAAHLARLGVRLPTFGELEEPSRIPPVIAARLREADPDAALPANLYRIHWHNDARRRGLVGTPMHIALPKALTGVDATILVALGDKFPLIGAHKVLPAYACMVTRLASGRFDVARNRALFPSTGNYCRGGVAVARILGIRGVALLPEGMSEERFEWLRRWVREPADIVKTPGTESDVKAIFDRCAAMVEASPDDVVLNQFREYANHVVHRRVTGKALERLVRAHTETHGGTLRLFVSASGSAGTLGAGDHLKDVFGAKIAAVEALECPTLLRNGFGAHNIQGIGDKHVPLVHNVMNTDLVVGVSDRATDALFALFNTTPGAAFLREARGLPLDQITQLRSLGISSICNVVAAIKAARRMRLGEGDVIVTVATDGASMYQSELGRIQRAHFGGEFGQFSAHATYARHLEGATDDDVLELTQHERERIFNLGYYTWVEQQGVSLDEFEARRSQAYWRRLSGVIEGWDELITELNDQAAALS